MLDPELQQLNRVDYFQEVIDRFARPELDMYVELRLRDYFHADLLWPQSIDCVNVLVYVPPRFMPEFLIEFERECRKQDEADAKIVNGMVSGLSVRDLRDSEDGGESYIISAVAATNEYLLINRTKKID